MTQRSPRSKNPTRSARAPRARRTARANPPPGGGAGGAGGDGLDTAGGTSFTGTGKVQVHENTPKGIWLSIRQFCEDTGRDRAVINNALRKVNLHTIQGPHGYPMYRMRDLISLVYERDAQGRIDPDKLDPYRRKAHYAAELDKLRLSQEASLLLPKEEHEQAVARLFKLTAQFLDTLPDILERDTGLKPLHLLKVQERLDQLRGDMYAAVVGEPEAIGARAAEDAAALEEKKESP